MVGGVNAHAKVGAVVDAVLLRRSNPVQQNGAVEPLQIRFALP